MSRLKVVPWANRSLKAKAAIKPINWRPTYLTRMGDQIQLLSTKVAQLQEQIDQLKVKAPPVKLCPARTPEDIQKLLDAALDQATSGAGINFVESCQEFFNKRGFLSYKQQMALKVVDSNPRQYKRGDPEWEDDSDPLDYDSSGDVSSWDFG